MLRAIYSQPDSAWQRISLPALTRIYRNPKVLENRVTLPGYEGELRQLTIMELGHEEPTVLLTNHRKLGPVELVTRYAQRMLSENGISEAVQFFHIDALSSMVGMKVDFDMQLTLAASVSCMSKSTFIPTMLESASIWKNWTASEIPFSLSMRCA